MMDAMNFNEYTKLKIFLDRHFEWYAPKYSSTPPGTPSQFLENIEKTSLSSAKKGLGMALNDIAEDSANWSPEAVAAADAKFLAAGTFTLSEVRRRYSKKYLQILKRGNILSEKEYYLLKGIRDGGGIESGATESQKIEAMMAAFESGGFNSEVQHPGVQ